MIWTCVGSPTNKRVVAEKKNTNRTTAHTHNTNNNDETEWSELDSSGDAPNAKNERFGREQKKVWKQQNFWEMFVHLYWKTFIYSRRESGAVSQRQAPRAKQEQYEMSLHWFLAEHDLHTPSISCRRYPIGSGLERNLM